MQIRINLLVRVVSELVPLFMGFSVLHTFITTGKQSPEELVFGIVFPVFCFFLWYLLHFSLFKKSKVTLEEDCICQVTVIQIGPFAIFRLFKKIRWDDVDRFERSFAGYWSGYMVWGKTNNNKTGVIILNSGLTTFSEKERQFIVNHLPAEKINDNAKKTLFKSRLFMR